MSYEIPYSSDFEKWYGTAQNVTRLSATLTQARNDNGDRVGRIACSWNIPDNGGTFIILVSTDGTEFSIVQSGITGNSAVVDVEPDTSCYVKVVTVLGTTQSEGTVSELLSADDIPVPNTPVITVRESGLIIDVGAVPEGYTAVILIDDGTDTVEVETSQPSYTYLCDPDDYEVSVAYRNDSGNVGEYSSPVSVTVEEVYVRKTSHYYIKRAEVNGDTLMLTTGDNQVILFRGGGGGGTEAIVQEDDTIILPTGFMDGTIKQEMLTALFYPTRMLTLSEF